jgi:hypothetical protein
MLRILVTCTALVSTFAARVKEDVTLHTEAATNASSSKNLCSNWLIVEYDDGSQEEGSTFGSFRYLGDAWTSVVLFTKTESDGCTKTYTAKCEDGGLEVKKVCGEETSTETRCLGGMSCFVSSRKSTLSSGDSGVVYHPDEDDVSLSAGKVVVYTVDPSKGIDLEDAPGDHNWKAEWGCYCCKHSYGLSNPFSFSSRRLAWKRGSDGNMECMLAWRMIGNGMDHENPSDSSVLGVFALIPEFVMTAADMMTLTIGRHLACAATCPLRNPKYEANKYAFTKIQTDMDKY